MFYHSLGELPKKRHVQVRKPDGSLLVEEVMGLEGFSGLQSILYHHHHPTRVKKVDWVSQAQPEFVPYKGVRGRQLRTADFPAGGDALQSLRPMMGNDDVVVSLSRPTEDMTYFYRNGQAYEVWFVHEGNGVLRTQLGSLPFDAGDYVVIPFGITWQLKLGDRPCRFLVIEVNSEVGPPDRYLNRRGQFLEHSPFCERDIRVPRQLETIDEMGEFEVLVKVRQELHRHIMGHHPFDVIAWDGCLYPWAFNIGDFEPITGRVHLPPPVHQTFAARNLVVCSFVPRMYDYHPEAIPAPYCHSNVNSDELLYYVEGNFMSRRGVEKFDWTLHPYGLPHGPQPGATEASIGKKRTEELAVMVDTFHPLQICKQALDYEVEGYAYSWMGEAQ